MPTVKEDGTLDPNDVYYKYNNNNFTITEEGTIANDIKVSVGKYGGFYIAKYEAGVPLDENGKEIIQTTAITSKKPRSVSGATTWNYITRTEAIIVAKNMIDTSTSGVKSDLITGECWDTTLQWMVNSSENAKNEPNVGFDIDSTGNGYYDKETRTITGQYAINNIYDMAGNVWEWTTENVNNTGKVIRGGHYGDSGFFVPSARRNSYSDENVFVIGFRVVMYK